MTGPWMVWRGLVELQDRLNPRRSGKICEEFVQGEVEGQIDTCPEASRDAEIVGPSPAIDDLQLEY